MWLRHPEELRDVVDGGVRNTRAEEPTDDGQLTIALARTFASAEAWSVEAIIAVYVDGRAWRPFDVGRMARRALEAARRAPTRRRLDAARKAADSLGEG